MSKDVAKGYIKRLKKVEQTYDFGGFSGLVHTDMVEGLRLFENQHSIGKSGIRL